MTFVMQTDYEHPYNCAWSVHRFFSQQVENIKSFEVMCDR